jgi:putative hydroxymethylpyrimidine transport system substrate-binding protein
VAPIDTIGVPTYNELVLIANSDRLKSDPAYAARVKKFVAALVAATNAVEKDPTGAGAILGSAMKTPTAFTGPATAATIAKMPPPGGKPTGCMYPQAWQSFINWMVANKLMSKSLQATSMVSDAYLPHSC